MFEFAERMDRSFLWSLFTTKKSRKLIGTLSVATFLVGWELAARWDLINAYYTSRPSLVFTTGIEILSGGNFSAHGYVSLIEFLAGFIMALVVGILLGMIMGTFRKIRYLLDPPIIALYTTPRLALLPILVLWLGIGMESKIAVVFIGAVIPIIINTMAGIREADFSLIQAARSFCARQRDIFTKVLLPGSLPAVMTGIRLGLGRAILGVVVGEMYASTKGIGYQIMHYGAAVRVDHLLFYVTLVSFFGFTTTTLVRNLENRLRRWREA